MDPKFSRRTVLSTVGTVTLVNAATVSASAKRQGSKAATNEQQQVRVDNFTVEIEGEEVPGWRSVTIPSRSIEQGTHREGNEAKHEKKLWGQVTYDDLEMERGFDPDFSELVEWRRAIQAGKADEGRKEIAVKLLNEEGEIQLQWEFREAWIKEYDPPELDTSAEDDVATESITVAFDRMERKEV